MPLKGGADRGISVAQFLDVGLASYIPWRENQGENHGRHYPPIIAAVDKAAGKHIPLAPYHDDEIQGEEEYQ